MGERKIHAGRRLEDWAELASRAVTEARRRLGDEEVARRLETAIAPDDYDTTVRVLRIVGRELQPDGTADLSRLDAALRGGAASHAERASLGVEAANAATDPDDSGADADREGFAARRRQQEPSLGELPEPVEPRATPADVAKELLRLRNPIKPHPRRGRGR